ncbi:MAG: membrane-bound O-acyltransferase family protein [Bdellovibrionaceae bacterium]|nr:membrane-bound O-acyltransferase family protein [Pseudobdellovibrionaceae bacterium]
MEFTENISILLISLFFALFAFFKVGLGWNQKRLNRFIAVYSVFLYATWFPPGALLLLAQGIYMHLVSPGIFRGKKGILGFSISLNLAILGFFKYYNFFVSNIFGVGHYSLELILPLGISFYTFTIIGHFVDLNRRKTQPMENIFESMLFVSFWPHLAAGPILRSKNMFSSMHQRFSFTRKDLMLATTLILWGITKKLLFADNLGSYVNWNIGYGISEMSSVDALATVVGYSAQIYFDFSGYTDMAIGLALLVGFRLPANFNYPYRAVSLGEFWERWHISLSTWFRDYLYIPLGGSRVSKGRNSLNIMVVFLLSGLWHGAAWNFVIWGGLHGIVLVLEKRFSKLFDRIPVVLRYILTMSIVVIAWSYFRLSFSDANLILSKVFMIGNEVRFITRQTPHHILPLFIGVAFVSLDHLLQVYKVNRQGEIYLTERKMNLLWVAALFLLALFLSGHEQPYIYFQF